jgi:phosphohistidine phosphatase
MIRHAVAEERDAERWPDDRERPLTAAGIRRFRRVARHLGRVLSRVDGVWTSPLVRARQTAEILIEQTGWPVPGESAALAPEAPPRGILGLLREHRGSGRIALVGHEPSLHLILGLLVSGSPEGAGIEMKKGGAALVRFDSAPAAGAGVLRWLLPPRAILVRD